MLQVVVLMYYTGFYIAMSDVTASVTSVYQYVLLHQLYYMKTCSQSARLVLLSYTGSRPTI